MLVYTFRVQSSENSVVGDEKDCGSAICSLVFLAARVFFIYFVF